VHQCWLRGCCRCGSSFDVAMVSAKFEGKTLIARHRLVRARTCHEQQLQVEHIYYLGPCACSRTEQPHACCCISLHCAIIASTPQCTMATAAQLLKTSWNSGMCVRGLSLLPPVPHTPDADWTLSSSDYCCCCNCYKNCPIDVRALLKGSLQSRSRQGADRPMTDDADRPRRCTRP
jgi:hypothetical protein